MNRAAVDAWFVEYDAAALHPDEQPPPRVRDIAARSAVVSSDMPRARASAQLIAQNDVIATPLLRESVLAIPELGATLPLTIWAVATGLRWSRDFRRKAWPDAKERARAHEAIDWLTAFGETSDSIVAVTHRVFREALSGGLLEKGWTEIERWRGNDYWSVRTYERQ